MANEQDLERLVVRLIAEANLKPGFEDGKRQTREGTRAIQSMLGEFSRSVGNEMSSAGGAVSSFGNVIGALASGSGQMGALVGLLKDSAVSAARFGKELANVAAIAPGNARLVTEFGEQVSEMSVRLARSTTELNQALYDQVSAYGANAESAKGMEIAVKNAAAGNATASQSIAVISGLTRAYGDTTLKAQQYASDLSLAIVRLGSGKLPELASSLGKVTGTSATMGVKMQELGAFMATFSGTVGTFSEVGTALAATLNGLLKPTKEMEAALKGIGYQSGLAAIEQLGLKGTLDKLALSVGGSKEKLGELWGQAEALKLVFPAVGKQAGELTAKMAEIKNISGETNQAFKAQTEGTGKAAFEWAKFTANLDLFSRTLGEKVLPVLTKTLEILNYISKALSSLPKTSLGVGNPLGFASGAFGLADALLGSGEPEKKAAGGPVSGPMLAMVGEDGPETIVPTGVGHRSDGIRWWKHAGRELGVPGFAGGGSVGASGGGTVTIGSEVITLGGATRPIPVDVVRNTAPPSKPGYAEIVDALKAGPNGKTFPYQSSAGGRPTADVVSALDFKLSGLLSGAAGSGTGARDNREMADRMAALKTILGTVANATDNLANRFLDIKNDILGVGTPTTAGTDAMIAGVESNKQAWADSRKAVEEILNIWKEGASKQHTSAAEAEAMTKTGLESDQYVPRVFEKQEISARVEMAMTSTAMGLEELAKSFIINKESVDALGLGFQGAGKLLDQMNKQTMQVTGLVFGMAGIRAMQEHQESNAKYIQTLADLSAGTSSAERWMAELTGSMQANMQTQNAVGSAFAAAEAQRNAAILANIAATQQQTAAIGASAAAAGAFAGLASASIGGDMGGMNEWNALGQMHTGMGSINQWNKLGQMHTGMGGINSWSSNGVLSHATRRALSGGTGLPDAGSGYSGSGGAGYATITGAVGRSGDIVLQVNGREFGRIAGDELAKLGRTSTVQPGKGRS